MKRRRKAAASALNRPSVQSYVPFLHLETADFIKDLYERGGHGAQPIDCMPMIQRLSLNLSLTLNWGDRIGSLDDHLFDEITECEEYISRYNPCYHANEIPLDHWKSARLHPHLTLLTNQ